MASAELLSPVDRARIREAVTRAERRTSGEIVPFLVERSAGYEVAVWRGACLAGVLAAGAMTLLLQLYRGWGLAWLYDPGSPLLITLAAGALGGLATALAAPLRRRLAGRDRLERAVRQRAARAFVEEEVFDTRDRTGILLFVSLFERRIEVLADAGIDAAVGRGAWQEVVDCIRDGLAAGRLADGMVSAIALCGELLERAGIDARADDTDELTDELRIRDEG